MSQVDTWMPVFFDIISLFLTYDGTVWASVYTFGDISQGYLHLCTREKSSVQFSFSVMSDSLWPLEPQHTRLPCPSPTARVYPNPCLLSQWCHPTISSSCSLCKYIISLYKIESYACYCSQFVKFHIWQFVVYRFYLSNLTQFYRNPRR